MRIFLPGFWTYDYELYMGITTHGSASESMLSGASRYKKKKGLLKMGTWMPPVNARVEFLKATDFLLPNRSG